MNQLKKLYDEFNLAYATCTKFNVANKSFFQNLLSNHIFHFTQGMNHTKINISTVYETGNDVIKLITILFRPYNYTRLDEGITFPLAPMCMEVVLKMIKVHCQRP